MMNPKNPTVLKVQDYYGKILDSNKDLKTNACCADEVLPDYLQGPLSKVHPEVLDKFYGCGAPIPEALPGLKVLDLGCGAGRDAYLLSSLVGEEGKVIGVDMTPAQLAVARQYQDYHREKFGFNKPNVEFKEGYMEDLEGLGIETNSIDLVISNCVLNLSPNKEVLFKEIFRVLKKGGELYFSDVFSGRRIPDHLKRDQVLLGECLAGAMYLEDFRRLLANLGIQDFRVVAQSPISINDREIKNKVGPIPFKSMTLRAFNLNLEDRCEDYGQVATYLGTIPQFPFAFRLDDHHLFEKGKTVQVCSNTAAMLHETRLARHFRVEGDLSTHFGIFDCSPSAAEASSKTSNSSCC